MNKPLFHLLSLLPFCFVADEITASILSPIDNNYFDNEIKYSLNGSILSLGNFRWLLTIWLTYDTEIFKFLANAEYDMPKSLCNFYKILLIIYLSINYYSYTSRHSILKKPFIIFSYVVQKFLQKTVSANQKCFS